MQRERLRWDRAVENLAVYLDEHGHRWPERAASPQDLLGRRPEQIFERYEYDRVVKSVREVMHPEMPGIDRGLSIG